MKVRTESLLSNRQSGFTLVELLFAIALASGVLLLLLNTVTTLGGRSAVLSNSSQTQQELLNVQQLLTARIREAKFIFPQATVVQLPASAKNKNLLGVTSTTVGSPAAPMLALLLPPKIPGTTCDAAQRDGCDRFYAYFPMLRSSWLAATSAGATYEQDYPGASPQNNDAWVLVVYMDTYQPGALKWTDRSAAVQNCYSTSAAITDTAARDLALQLCIRKDAVSSPVAGATNFSTSNTGVTRLVADYLVPLTATANGSDHCAPLTGDAALPASPALFTLSRSCSQLPGAKVLRPGYAYNLMTPPYISSVTLNLAAQKAPSPRVPAEDAYTLNVAASNLGR